MITASKTKVCFLCGLEKSIDQFSKDRYKQDGLGSNCKQCLKERREANKHPTTPEESARRSALRLVNLEETRKKEREYARSHRSKNREIYAQRSAEWRKQNPEYLREYLREYKRNNKARVKAWEHKRRAAKKRGGLFTHQEWIELCEYYDNRCLRCGSQEGLTPDHIVPLSKNGTNTIDNIQPLCGKCNSWKGSKTIDFRFDVVNVQ